MSEASENRHPSRVSEHVVTWVQLEDPQVTWLCFPLKLQKEFEPVRCDEEVDGLSYDSQDPGYSGARVREDEELSRLKGDFQDIGFLRNSITDVVPLFKKDFNSLIKNSLCSDKLNIRVNEVLNKRDPRVKIETLISIYEDKHPYDGLYRLMKSISKYNSEVASSIKDMYQELNNKYLASNRSKKPAVSINSYGKNTCDRKIDFY